MTRSAALAAAVSLSLLVLAADASADGPPVGGWSTSGVAVGTERYLAVPYRHGTLVEQVAVRGGQLLRYSTLRRQLGVPMVALDGSGGGLSHDESTLVLTAPRSGYPARTSTFYLLRPQSLGVRQVLKLKGDFSFDAISPDAATIYLIQLNSRDPSRYAVRALDTASGRLVPQPVVDPREPDEAMRGYPRTRLMSTDGRFAYTLYDNGDKQFVHALDTSRRTAACIDIPLLPQSADRVSLRLDGQRLAVLADGEPVSYIDTATRRVTRATAAPPPAAHHNSGGSGAPPLWAFAAGIAAAALGAGTAMAARRRRATALRS